MELIYLFGLGAVSLILWLAVQRQKNHDHSRSVWKGFAKRFRARYEEEGKANATVSSIRLLLRRDGVNLTAELDGVSQPTTAATRIRAQVQGVQGFELRVFREDVLSALSRAIGFQNIAVGDPVFDHAYHVRSNNEDLAKAWLEPELRRGIMGCEGYRFSMMRGEAVAERVGVEFSPFVLGAVFQVVADLAKGGERLLQRSRVLAAELGGVISAPGECWEPNGKVLTVLDWRGCQVLIDAVTDSRQGLAQGRIRTRVRARPLVAPEVKFVILSHRNVEPPPDLEGLPIITNDEITEFTASFVVMSPAPETMSQMLSTEILDRIKRLKPLLVSSDGRDVSVLISGLIFDAPTITAAMELAVELGSPPAGFEAKGPYR